MITPELRLALKQMAESTRQRVSRYIILHHERGRKGSQYRCQTGVDILVKQKGLSKPIKALNEKPVEEHSLSNEKPTQAQED